MLPESNENIGNNNNKMCDHSKGWRPEDGVPDLAMMSDISDESISLNLKTRYLRDEIYTYSGSILIAINPYKPLNIYNQEWISKFRQKDFDQNEPHVYALAEAMYMNLVMPNSQQTSAQTQFSTKDNDDNVKHRRDFLSFRRNQACVISGESGAGKTETTKFILSYLCAISPNKSTWIEQQILEASTILEAFGNAKTVRNDNSSRFGKFIQISFDSHCQINGCVIQDYLLEQSRITCQSKDERNYHVFYQLLCASQANKELKEKYQLLSANDYNYLSQSNCNTIDKVDDGAMFDSLRMAMSVLGMEQDDCDTIFCVLSAILLLGNIKFQAQIDANDEKSVIVGQDAQIVEKVSALLGINSEELISLTLMRQINVRGAITEIPFSVEAARDNRNGIAKALYSHLFTWIVNFLNDSTKPCDGNNCFLGVLDIFGFENFETNSFEQLCINYANEKLHMFFNHHMFAMEQELYRREELEFCTINFTDNTLCLELLEKPPSCILRLLSEECRMPKGNDSTFIEKLHNEFSQHPFYIKGDDRRNWSEEFSIRHFAGPVTYKAEGILSKNKDVQQTQLFDVLKNSRKNLLKTISKHQLINSTEKAQVVPTLQRRSSCIESISYSNQKQRPSLTTQQSICLPSSATKPVTNNQVQKTKPTVADTFRHQLLLLVELLNFADPWYVRCIKTNLEKSAFEYDEKQVRLQLKYLGMSDLIKIRREGHPIHLTKHQFVCRYRCLLRQNLKKNPNESPLLLDEERLQQTCVRMANQLGLDSKHWKLGKTMIFLRTDIYIPLEKMRNELFVRMAVIIQKTWRGYVKRKYFNARKQAAIIIQQAFRAHKDRLSYLRHKRAILTIQAHTRGMLAREIVNAMRKIKIEEKIRQSKIKQEQEESERMQRQVKENGNSNQPMTNGIHDNSLEPNLNAMEEPEDSNQNLTPKSLSSNNGEKPRPSSISSRDEKELNELIDVLKKHGITTDGLERHGENVYADLEKLYESLNCQQRSCNSSVSGDQLSLNVPTNCDADSVSCSGQSQISGSIAEKNDSTANSNNEADEESEDESDDSQSENQDQAIIDSHINQYSDSIESIDSIVSSSYGQSNDNTVRDHQDEVEQENSNILNQDEGEAPKRRCDSQQPFPCLKLTTNGSFLEKIEEEPNSITTTPSNKPTKTLTQTSFKTDEIFESNIERKLPSEQQKIIDNANEIMKKRLERKIIQAQTFESNQNYYQKNEQERVEEPPSTSDGEAQQPTGETEPTYSEKVERALRSCNIIEFAENHFNNHPRNNQFSTNVIKTLTRRRKSSDESCEYLSKIEMLSYSSSFSIHTSHIRMHCPQNAQLSCSIFKNLCRYMSTESMKFENEVKIMQSIVGHGIGKVELRDEIYVQILRQLTNNPSRESCLKLWILLGLVSSSFPPSKNFNKYLIPYIKEKPKKDPLIICHSQFVLDNLQTQRTHLRKFRPSIVEILACKKRTSLTCRIDLLSGSQEIIVIHPCDTAFDALTKLAHRINLHSIEGWALYETDFLHYNKQTKNSISKVVERSIRPSCLITDLIAKRSSKNDLSNQASSKSKTNDATINLTLKKRLFKGSKINNDLVEINLLYHQALLNAVKKDSYLVEENVAITLAGLQSQIMFGNFNSLAEETAKGKKNKNQKSPPSFKQLAQLYNKKTFINTRIRKNHPKSNKEWANIIMKAHKRNQHLNDTICKIQYLSIIINNCSFFYETTIFPVVYKGYQSIDQNICLGVNKEGIVIMRIVDKAPICAFRYSELEKKITVYADENILQMNINDKSNNDIRCFSFETYESEEIALLIVSYSPTHDINLRSSTESTNLTLDLNFEIDMDVKRVKLKMTLEDRMRIYQEVQNARRALVLNGKLRKLPQEQTNNKLRSTLKKLSSKSNKPDFNSRFENIYGTLKSSNTKDVPRTNSDYRLYVLNQKPSQEQDGFDDVSGATLSTRNDDCSKLYPYSFWAYTKYPIQSSLLLIYDPDLEEAAITNFNSILRYSGLLIADSSEPMDLSQVNDSRSTDSGLASSQSIYQYKKSDSSSGEIYERCPKKLDKSELLKLAQENLERCLKDGADILKNEFFLQLIKQTTDHPESSSEVNIRHWQLLSLACSITYPTDVKILAYLFAHLRRCAIDQVTDEGQYARFTLRNLQGTVDTKGRKYTPSETEILSTINCRRVCARVYFLDDQFQTVEFDPCATIAEVVDQIKQKIGLRKKCDGYALFQPLDDDYEQVLHSEEKVGDAISSWELWHKQRQANLNEQIQQQLLNQDSKGNISGVLQRANHETLKTVSRSRTHRFIFKKYLFINSMIDMNDPVERELLYYQTIGNIKCDRFPLQENEAYILCALKAQIDIGNSSKLAHLTLDQVKMVYKQIIMSLMPPHTFNSISPVTIAQQHQALRELSAQDAKRYFSNLFQSFGQTTYNNAATTLLLHRAHVYKAVQTFASAWPSDIWIAINQTGLHMLIARTKRILLSCDLHSMEQNAYGNYLVVITQSTGRIGKTKYTFYTKQAQQISTQLNDYDELLNSGAQKKSVKFNVNRLSRKRIDETLALDSDNNNLKSTPST